MFVSFLEALLPVCISHFFLLDFKIAVADTRKKRL
jgi:hypothetical protein